MVLSVPVILLFAVGMLDLVRGYHNRSRGYQAARHLSWATERSREDGSAAPAPAQDELVRLHFDASEGAATLNASADPTSLRTSARTLPDLADTAWQTAIGRLSAPVDYVGFLTGSTPCATAHVRFESARVLRWARHAVAHHSVCLNGRPGTGTGDPMDVLAMLRDALLEKIRSPMALLKAGIDAALKELFKNPFPSLGDIWGIVKGVVIPGIEAELQQLDDYRKKVLR
jgi:hypothetical protein